VAFPVVPVAASSLLAGLLDASTERPTALVEVARTRTSVHYETGHADVPVLCVCLPAAVRLPNALVAGVLPTGRLMAEEGAVVGGDAAWRVRRWWTPPRPRGLAVRAAVSLPGIAVAPQIRPMDLVGAGPGLTPSGDDLLAGALVAAHATADPRLAGWQGATRQAVRARRTTAVSRGLLRHALDGWATTEVADFVTGVCSGAIGDSADRLLAVGHSSGAALASGVLHVLTSAPLEGAA
jgi:hypothetical protein